MVGLSWKKKEGWGLSMRRELLLTRFDRIGVQASTCFRDIRATLRRHAARGLRSYGEW